MKKILSLLLFLAVFSVSAQSFDSAKLDQYLLALDKNDKAMLSLAVLKDSEVIYQKSIGFSDVESRQKVNNSTQYRIGSITKVFTATMIFQLIEEGKLALDTKLAQFYPDVKNADEITISMLLSHRSGIHNFTDTPEYQQYMTQHKTKAQMISLIESLDSDFSPNSRSKYSNSAYVLLGYIIEDITDDTYANQLRKRITSRLNLDRTVYGGAIDVSKNQAKSYTPGTTNWYPATVTDLSIPHGAGAIISTPTQIAKFLSSLLNGELLSAASLTKMKEINNGFGRGLVKFPFYDKTAFGHNGGIDGFSSITGHFEDDNVTFALTSNGMNYAMNNINIAILSIYYGLPFDIPDFDKKAIVLAQSDLIKYEGVFVSEKLPFKITLKVNNGQLTAQATGQNVLNLSPYSISEFRFEPAGIVMIFKTADEADFSTFQLKQGGGDFIFTRE